MIIDVSVFLMFQSNFISLNREQVNSSVFIITLLCFQFCSSSSSSSANLLMVLVCITVLCLD